jgi:N-methylhydantoinase A/oxoprolinase/acetone carboxylase beta subunit
VGVLGIGHRPHLRRARKRTRVGEIRLAPGRSLQTVHEFVDATAADSTGELEAAAGRLAVGGAEALCVSEAFGVEDARMERKALDIAAAMGLPACAGHELTGLYGLELRTVTGAVNAGILPAALRAAEVVEEAVQLETEGAAVLVMRGDGGSAGMHSMRTHPLLTAFSGPAASVCGALRHLSIRDAVVVEVGGTSSNVTVIKAGRPALAYVRVLDHVTCVRSIDIQVGGVAGGSLVRMKRGRSLRIADVGPRSAHIAGLDYSCFTSPERLRGGRLELIAPRAGDTEDYAVIATSDGGRVALTPTCAANALGRVPPGSYSRGNAEAARIAFETAAEALGTAWNEVAEQVLATSGARVAALVSQAIAGHRLAEPVLIGVGGGAGAIVPTAASQLGIDAVTPPDGEVISSVGDALSLIRVEVERSAARSSRHALDDLHREAEEAAIRAGAAPVTVRTESEAVPDRGAVRVVAHGSVALESGALPGDAVAAPDEIDRAARDLMGDEVRLVTRNDFYSVFAAPNGGSAERFAVLDSRGTVATSGEGLILAGDALEVSAQLMERFPGLTKHVGPFSVAPGVRVLRSARLVDLTVVSKPEEALEAALAECRMGNGDPVVALITK